MKNLPKEKRNRIILIALGTGILLAGIWQGLVSLQQRKLKAIAQGIVEKQEKVEGAGRLVNSTNEISEILGHAGAKLRGIESQMASGDMLFWITQTLNNFLNSHNFREERKVEIMQFSREVLCDVGLFPKFPYQAAKFNVFGAAYYHDFGAFVAELENTYPFIRVQNIELDPAAGSPTAAPADSEKLAFKMEIVALVNPSGR